MVTSVTSFSVNGLRDWLVQRISAVVVGIYLIMLFSFFFLHPHPSYQQWKILFTYPWLKIFTLLTLISILAHAWIGIWTVLTDYVKLGYVRVTLQVLLALSLFVYLLWGMQMVWGL